MLQRQAAAALLAAQVHSLTFRLQGYEEQIGMVRAKYSMSSENRTLENDVFRDDSRTGQTLSLVGPDLGQLKIGTKAEIPRKELTRTRSLLPGFY